MLRKIFKNRAIIIGSVFVTIIFICIIVVSSSDKNSLKQKKINNKNNVQLENLNHIDNIPDKKIQKNTSTQIQNKISGNLPVNNVENMLGIQKVVYGFASAYFGGKRDVAKKYVYKINNLDVYTDYYDDVKVYISCLKGLDNIKTGEKTDIINVSLEFLDLLISDDSYMYLSIELIKTKNGWKIKNYGLEK